MAVLRRCQVLSVCLSSKCDLIRCPCYIYRQVMLASYEHLWTR